LQRVWQDISAADDSSIESRAEKVRLAFQKLGYSVSQEKEVVKFRCYADRENHAVVNYDGNIYHCTARDFTPESAEGVLSDNGDIVNNDRYQLRNQIKWGNETCLQCSIYPLCHGRCSQQKMDYIGKTGCLTGYTDEQKESILHRRVQTLLDRMKRKESLTRD
jgi:uncharacterized protein